MASGFVSDRLSIGLGFVSALLCSFCCTLQLALNFFSIGCAGISTRFESARPYLLTLTLASLIHRTLQLYGVYDRIHINTAVKDTNTSVTTNSNGKSCGEVCCPASAESSPKLGKKQYSHWIMVAFTLILAFSPDILKAYNNSFSIANTEVDHVSSNIPVKNATLVISGMHCESCRNGVIHAIQVVEGLESFSVTIDPPRAHLQILYKSDLYFEKVIDDCIHQIEKAGFDAVLVPAAVLFLN